MDDARRNDLAWNADATPTDEEIADGWHYCWDWDGLFIGPGMGEMDSCTCEGVNKSKHVSPPRVVCDLSQLEAF